jgi:integrase
MDTPGRGGERAMTYGEGTIFKSKDPKGRTKWKVEVVIGHHPDGSRKRTRRTARSHADAVQIRKQLMMDRDEYNLSFDNPTLDEFALWWIRDVRALKVKASTAADYEYRYRKMISPTFGALRLNTIDPRGVSTWANNLLGSYAADTVNGALRVLKMVMGAAVEHGHLRTNPATPIPHVKSHRATSRDNPPWDSYESRRAIEAAKDHWFGLAVLIALCFGLRKGEILGLKWGDIDFDAGLLHVRCSRREYLAYNSDGTSRLEETESDPKTRSSMRSIPIGKIMAKIFETAMDQAPGAPFDVDHRYLILDRTKTGPISTTVFTRSFLIFLKDTRLRRVRFHDLRHSAAQSALASGVRIESVSQSLGHSRIDVTKSIYAPLVQPLNAEFSLKNQETLFRSNPS